MAGAWPRSSSAHQLSPLPGGMAASIRWPSVRQSGQAYKVAQGRNVGAVRSDARGVHGQAESFGDLLVNPGVVEFREAEADHRQDAGR
jgi:hypothetical protein